MLVQIQTCAVWHTQIPCQMGGKVDAGASIRNIVVASCKCRPRPYVNVCSVQFGVRVTDTGALLAQRTIVFLSAAVANYC